MALKIIFAGTSDFAVPALTALMHSPHHVCAVYTKPDSFSGRGLKLTYSPVKQATLDRYPHVPVLQPVSLKSVDIAEQLRAFKADIMIVIAYGLILPEPLLSLFKYGCMNVHGSLLPRWRGAAPVTRTLLAGDEVTGVTIMQVDAGLDTGPILHRREYVIQPQETARTLHDTLALLGANTLREALDLIETGEAVPQEQDNTLATYAAKIAKSDATIDWYQPAALIERQVRAFNPWPTAFTYLSDQMLKIWEAEVITMEMTNTTPGQIIAANAAGIDIAAKPGILRLLSVQIQGGKRMTAHAFLNSRAQWIIPHQTILGAKSC